MKNRECFQAAFGQLFEWGKGSTTLAAPPGSRSGPGFCGVDGRSSPSIRVKWSHHMAEGFSIASVSASGGETGSAPRQAPAGRRGWLDDGWALGSGGRYIPPQILGNERSTLSLRTAVEAAMRPPTGAVESAAMIESPTLAPLAAPWLTPYLSSPLLHRLPCQELHRSGGRLAPRNSGPVAVESSGDRKLWWTNHRGGPLENVST
jgi:hypothetical protein